MTPASHTRPNPDSLLAAARQEGRGRLKVFLGAAPGVGKTYAMLSGARRLQAARFDVVVGVVETHGRVETEAVLDGLEVLPRQSVAYKGTQLSEFDLDAALARRPALLIVDELAHTNAEECRHPKRYLDVEELLAAGIDVWTAVNIQHLESLSDVVSRITGVLVRETVPDTVIDKADEVVVVDITPAELITRLSEGRIYLPENAKRAAGGFFKPGNLTALRELALRRTAESVDHQMVDHLRRNAIEGAWPTAERILVCVGSDPSSERVVRAASRLANGLNAAWVAVTLERSDFEMTDAVALGRIDEAMRLAERLGADTARLSGPDLPDEILRFARRENITQIVIGRSSPTFWARVRGRSLSGMLLRRASDIAVHVVVGERTAKVARRRLWPARNTLAIGLTAALGSVGAAVLVGMLASRYLSLPNLSMIFLAAVLGCAVTVGQWPAIAAAILSFLAYNFFFIPPIFSFSIATPYEFFTLIIFLLVGMVTGGLAGRVRDQANAARARMKTMQSLYDVSRKLSATVSMEDVLWVLARQTAGAIRGQVVMLLCESDGPEAGELTIKAAFPPEDTLQPSEWAAARWAFSRTEVAGWRTGTLPNAFYQFHPIRTSSGTIGTIGISPSDRGKPLSAEEERAFAALLDQGALAIERAILVVDARRGEALAERERLQTTLLSSISHDLRTPLSSILGSATSLREYGGRMEQADRDDLVLTIVEEARRLTRFVANLLDMTRVESGSLALRRDWIETADVIMAAVTRSRKSFPSRIVETRVPATELPVGGDPMLFEQVLFNILDNADKYAEPGTPTVVVAEARAERVIVTIEDEGRGIPAADLDRVFEKFTRLGSGDGRPAGTGLGLAIAKGVVEAMGGTIRAESPARAGRGTRITIALPVAEPSAAKFPAAEEEQALAGVALHSRR
ncbi:sensor histidine kinase KdpD [Lichenifustis flavocetrariae]|uniref:histidine kinase n=1 Tax=Lichenifustis flavocetrariae TaxID=2949735 RepID=A0AA41Z3Q6_9HYPH|nr:sensor histidine kinase KdpD [Lichenifustis flavocetrariae]MCW6512225.1 sensor histidine kinase KdpD [Lichenifustis flavocetrariae]